MEDAKKFMEQQIADHKIVVFSKNNCRYSTMAKNALTEIGAVYVTFELDTRADCAAIQDVLKQMTGSRTVSIHKSMSVP